MRHFLLTLLVLAGCGQQAFKQDKQLLPGHSYAMNARMDNEISMDRTLLAEGTQESFLRDKRSLRSSQQLTLGESGMPLLAELSLPLYRTTNTTESIEADLGGWTAHCEVYPDLDSLRFLRAELDSSYQPAAASEDVNRITLAANEVGEHLRTTLNLMQQSLRETYPELGVGQEHQDKRKQQMMLGPFLVSWQETRSIKLEILTKQEALYRITLAMEPDSLPGFDLKLEASGEGLSRYDRNMHHPVEHRQRSELSIQVKDSLAVWTAHSLSELEILTEIKP